MANSHNNGRVFKSQKKYTQKLNYMKCAFSQIDINAFQTLLTLLIIFRVDSRLLRNLITIIKKQLSVFSVLPYYYFT